MSNQLYTHFNIVQEVWHHIDRQTDRQADIITVYNTSDVTSHFTSVQSLQTAKNIIVQLYVEGQVCPTKKRISIKYYS